MLKLTRALQAWGSATFEAVLKDELEKLDTTTLPLQQGLSQSSHAIDDNLGVTIIRVSENPDFIRVKAGIHYSGVIAGCSCADDPTPVDECAEYCEVWLNIDRRTAETTVRLLAE